MKNTYMVVCRYYRRTKNADGVSQSWRFYMHFHPQCWIDQAIASLSSRRIAETRGRKRLEITDEMREARLKVLRRRAAVVQRIRAEVSNPVEEQNVDRIIHLGKAINDLKMEIELLGGAPKSW